jgi:hypothetical protein
VVAYTWKTKKRKEMGRFYKRVPITEDVKRPCDTLAELTVYVDTEGITRAFVASVFNLASLK